MYRNDSYGGVALLIHRSIQSHLVSFNINNVGIELIRVKLLNCIDLEHVVAIYCPSSIHTQISHWNDIFSRFTSKTLIAGDFNGHHTNWSTKSDTRGTQILDSALENDFISLNNGMATRIKLVNGNLQQNSPDISFVSSDIAIKFDWQVFNENLGSDHLIIKMSANLSSLVHIVRKRNWKNADWSKFRQTISDKIKSTFEFNTDIFQQMYNLFINIIEANKHIPYYKFSLETEEKFKPKNYWNSKLSEIVAQRRLALSRFRKNPTPENLNKWDYKTESQTLIKKAKCSSWHNFCDSINEVTNVSEMWRRMRWMKGYKQIMSSPIEKQTALLRSLTPDYAPYQIPRFNSINVSLEADFHIQELENCLKKKDSAPGADGISYSMLFNLPEAGNI